MNTVASETIFVKPFFLCFVQILNLPDVPAELFNNLIFTKVKKVYRSKARMYRATHGVLKKDELLWVDLPGFVQAEQKLAGFVQQLTADESGQNKDSRGVTMDKSLEKDLLVSKMREGAAVLYGIVKTEELKQRLRLRSRKLSRIPELTLVALATDIRDLIQQESEALESQGINTEWIAEMNSLIQRFTDLIGQVRIETVTKGSATLSIEEVVYQTDDLLQHQLDGMMERFRRTNPDFLARYKSARVIVDQGSVKRSSTEEDSDPAA
jgi:hypothetical protein